MRLALLILALLLCACAPTAHAASNARLLVPVTVRGGTTIGSPAGEVNVATLVRASGTLHAVAASGARGWAVGNDGAILATRDAGATWAPQSSGTRQQLFAVAVASPEVAWAGGWQGTIVATTDGGTTWRAQPTGATAAIRAISAVSDRVVWAVGGNGTLLRTVDGGATWARLPAHTQANLLAIAPTSPTSAWIVGDEGRIYHTSDGGATLRTQWAFVAPPEPTPTEEELPTNPVYMNFFAVAAVSDQMAWAVGVEELPGVPGLREFVGVSMGTKDGGATWVRQPVPDGVQGVYALVAGSPAHLWIAGFDDRVHASRDGGVTWTSSGAARAGGSLTGMAAFGADRVWVVGGSSLLEGRYVSARSGVT